MGRWGDFIDTDQLVFGPSSNKWFGQFPLPLPPAASAPPPSFGTYTGLATCGLCVDIVNHLNALYSVDFPFQAQNATLRTFGLAEARWRQHAKVRLGSANLRRMKEDSARQIEGDISRYLVTNKLAVLFGCRADCGCSGGAAVLSTVSRRCAPIALHWKSFATRLSTTLSRNRVT